MIGLYDSGVGGLSVWKELIALLPSEDYRYLSDGLYCPYGPKDPDFICERAETVSRFLLGEGCDIIVVACNTATAASISYLRSHFQIPFVGMEPAIKPAALHSKSGVVGVLATAGTFKGRLYLDTLARFAGDVKVIERVGTGLVELVERGELEGENVNLLLRKYVDPMIEQGADHIVLGCTHYPFLENELRKIIPSDVDVVNPAPAVARQCARLVGNSKPELHTNRIGTTDFFSTGSTEVMKTLVRLINPRCSDDCFKTILL